MGDRTSISKKELKRLRRIENQYNEMLNNLVSLSKDDNAVASFEDRYAGVSITINNANKTITNWNA